MTDTYELFAIKYGHHPRTASHNFIGGDAHDGPMPLDYFIWLARNEARTFVIDTGFSSDVASRRGRILLRSPVEGLRLLGANAGEIRDVVITHLHYDHVGNFDLFPKATFHLQDLEMQFATGRHMASSFMRQAYDVDSVVGMVRAVYKEQVRFHSGDAELAPGLSVHLIGGHTMGLQVVRVKTIRGWVVVASDASHMYANMTEHRPFPVVHDVGAMTQGWRRLLDLADSPDHIVPGHDPEVVRRYQAPSDDLTGIVMRLDARPSV